MADQKIGPTFGQELAAAGLGDGIAWDPEAGTLQFTGVPQAEQDRAAQVLADHDPTRRPAPYMTGKDVIDGMSRAQANDPAVDRRDLVRIGAAPRAAGVKSCIARIERDLKAPAGTLLAQSTATGGT